jgi:hypothetical protein
VYSEGGAAGRQFYSLDEITQNAQYLPEPAATIVATAPVTGVCDRELRGAGFWKNYAEDQLRVPQSY